ncbi:hypothetical protein [Donghicola sp. XS_ASV15]|uniref:hypothetical protein n=1 Tax=Donghicola sp. XS_ASV15 TaxID=3241295 RepID=UPI00351427BC
MKRRHQTAGITCILAKHQVVAAQIIGCSDTLVERCKRGVLRRREMMAERRTDEPEGQQRSQK